ncbi:hypothetical protein ONR75_21515 [Rhodopseudomonas sp. P2A-2r]|uniref:hypothetical protein n=1 Tax=Rhodopseudomonas sp. P2A-2r TaxID=2991972 RepID=UPI002233EB90|nr:hypothetical protein [Rhodopseudomonas sp. P2A-2r]UZE47496.1 hypothetical protein ONR75_21515 [Rhodopseudomonas sp. P2A-2r]
MKFGLTLPIGHLLRIATATIAMAAVLDRMPEARSFGMLALHIAAGAAIYIVVLALLYARTLARLLRSRAATPHT